jgi:hypothetical protein
MSDSSIKDKADAEISFLGNEVNSEAMAVFM